VAPEVQTHMASRRPVPLVSIVIPCRNEEQHIARCLDSVLASDYPRERLEILVADGRSRDGTLPILVRYAALHPTILLLDNPRGTTPAGLNVAIRAASGDIVIRMDAQALYPPDYISRLVAGLQESGADKVGGVIVTVPADDSPTAQAIAVGQSHPFGVGNTVAFGCYRREIFDRIGLFDEELIRNQDDEFNFRLITQGGRVLLLPDIVSHNDARYSFRQLSHTYYEQGYFKPLVARKAGRAMTVGQLIPAVLVACLSTLAALAAWIPAARYLFALLGGGYALLVVVFAASGARSHGLRCAAALTVVFPVLHFSYGSGFLQGIRDHLVGYDMPRQGTLQLSR
jgi:glycosyltransferase involved in cell wall biosynthesis